MQPLEAFKLEELVLVAWGAAAFPTPSGLQILESWPQMASVYLQLGSLLNC